MKLSATLRTQFALPLLCLLVVPVATGCGKEATPEPETPPAASAEPAAAPAEDKSSDDPAKSNLDVSEEIMKACGLTSDEAHFSYNSAKVSDKDSGIFKKLADCFSTGPLKGKTMRLVGHADPRGEPEYNIALGGQRADNVATAIKNAGLAESQMETTSRGELDARGTDEASWAADRRVAIMLAGAE